MTRVLLDSVFVGQNSVADRAVYSLTEDFRRLLLSLSSDFISFVDPTLKPVKLTDIQAQTLERGLADLTTPTVSNSLEYGIYTIDGSVGNTTVLSQQVNLIPDWLAHDDPMGWVNNGVLTPTAGFYRGTLRVRMADMSGNLTSDHQTNVKMGSSLVIQPFYSDDGSTHNIRLTDVFYLDGIQTFDVSINRYRIKGDLGKTWGIWTTLDYSILHLEKLI